MIRSISSSVASAPLETMSSTIFSQRSRVFLIRYVLTNVWHRVHVRSTNFFVSASCALVV